MRQIERLYRDLAETSNDLIWAVDANGRITFMSSACRTIYGREPEEMIGRSFLEFVPPDQYQKDLVHFTEALQSGQETVDYVSRVYRKDGSIVTLSANARIVYDENGRAIGGHGISRDMTESLRAREAQETSDREQRALVAQLETERARLVAAQAAAKAGDWEIDLSTRAVIWSAEMYRIVEMDPDRWSPTLQGALSLVHPEDRAAVEEAFGRSHDERVPRTLDHRLSMPDGRIKFVEQRWHSVCDERGQPVRAVGTCQDITERQQAETTAIRLAAIVQSSDDAIVGKDLNGIITSWNHGAERIFGYAADEIVGTSITRLIPADRQDEESVILGKIKRSERVEHFETRRQTKDGRLIDVSVTASPIRDATGQVVGVSKLARDITERKQSETRLRRSNRIYVVLSDINQTIVREKDRQTMLDAACRIVVEKGQFRMAWVGLVDAGGRVQITAHAGATPGTLHLLSGWLGHEPRDCQCAFTRHALQTGQDGVCDDIPRDPQSAPLRDATLALGYRAMASLPLKIEARVIGAFNVYAGEAGVFDATEMLMLDGLASDIAFALDVHDREIERRRIEQELRESEAQLRDSLGQLHDVSARLNLIREQERARMAREIHDHLGQALTALKMDVAEVGRRLKVADTAAAAERLREMSALIDASVDDVRRVAIELRPVHLDDLGLVAAIRAYLNDVERRAKVQCVFTTQLSELQMADERATALFRILQEALTNAVRHAAAQRIEVSLAADSEVVQLVVRDDGRGISPLAQRNSRALGLVGMRDRALLFGGDVAVTGGPGQGTTVTAHLPIG